jgi:hypothetical protein
MWQRGPVWQQPRQVLLVDSILRGMDIPKIYLRKLPTGNAHLHDVVDGQQRLRTIWAFRSGQLALNNFEPLPSIEGHSVAGLKYAALHKSLRDRFDAFEVSVAEISSASPDEIASLFSRLQMGVSLNPAELRNAMLTPLRHVIDGLARSHLFFADCKIADVRSKRQDYVAHAFAMAAYRGERDIKAPNLSTMTREYTPDRTSEILEMSAEVGDALNVLAEVNRFANHRITQKWIFVDLCFLIMQRHKAGAVVDPTKLYASYDRFERRRREFTAEPQALIRGRRNIPALDRHLYNYIEAFRLQGGVSENLKIRASALQAFCPDIEGRI